MAKSQTRAPALRRATDKASTKRHILIMDAGAIARLAYQRYEARGRMDGRDVEDWLTAERDLREGKVDIPRRES